MSILAARSHKASFATSNYLSFYNHPIIRCLSETPKRRNLSIGFLTYKTVREC